MEMRGTSVNGPVTKLAAVLREAFARADDWFAEGRGIFEWPSGQEASSVERLMYHNFQVWNYEDMGRSGIDAQVLEGWHGAMRHNKFRNECINALDASVLPAQSDCAPLHSESLGALLDRITILHLKFRNYEPRCSTTAGEIRFQRDELVDYAVDLSRRVRNGEVRFQRVPRLKLYLEPSPVQNPGSDTTSPVS